MSEKVEVLNVNVPDYRGHVDATKYNAAKDALLQVLPKGAPGLTQKEMMAAMKTTIDQELFPGGAKSGWWTKCVQLDLEARGVVVRESTKPLRWHQV